MTSEKGPIIKGPSPNLFVVEIHNLCQCKHRERPTLKRTEIRLEWPPLYLYPGDFQCRVSKPSVYMHEYIGTVI